MKTRTRLLALFLCLVTLLALVLTSCSEKSDKETEKDIQETASQEALTLTMWIVSDGDNKISDADIKDGARDYRMMCRAMVDAIVGMGEYNRFSKGIFGWVGYKTKWLPYENIERAAGQTKWSFWKLFKYSLDGIINFSSAPLNISSWAGIVFCIVAFAATVFFFARRLIFGDPVTGWASTACLITFIGGVQLFCVGVLGQYISRIYLESKGRPKFIVRETNRKEDEET